MKPSDTVITRWLNEIDLAKKREKVYRKEGQKVIDIYGGKKIEDTPFNILYSNTETLLPACYSLVPIPVVQRRFKDDDPLGKNAAQAGERMLKFLLDTNVDGYETFDDGMKAAVLDALLPGRGVTAVKYDADLEEMGQGETQADPATEDEEGETIAPPKEAEAGEPTDPEEPEMYKSSELVCLETKVWNKVYFGYATKWSKVPWIAYEMEIDKEEAVRLEIPDNILSKIKFTKAEFDRENDEPTNEDDRNKGDRRVATIYQIWDKDGGKKIRYVCSQYKDGYLKETDDPLQLTGFFNCPKPLRFLEKNDQLPVALYALYENQAKELNDLTRRINLTIHAIKAKALYDRALGDDVKALLEAEDNDVVPATNESSLAADKGFQNAIWFWPIENLAAVLQILVATRDQCKQVIYEVTGISDILRGASVASETATAQKIKSQWGSLRLKRLQKEVQRYSRDLLRMMLEVAATKFSEETWAKMTGLPFLLDAQFNTLTSISQALQQQIQAQMQIQPLPPGSPPPPIAQELQKVQQQLQTPKWSDVLNMLRDDIQRAYRIDIETNSTIEAEATEDKEQMAEVMAAVGQALNGLTPLVTAGTLPFEAAQAMLLTIVRRFRFGPEVEDMIKAMKQPTPPDQGQKQAEAQMQQMQAQLTKQQQEFATGKAQSETAAAQMQAQLDAANVLNQQQKREFDIAKREIQLKAEEDVFKLTKQVADQMLAQKEKSQNDSLAGKQKIAQLEQGKMKTENVVNKKADETIGKGVEGLKAIVSEMGAMQKQLMEVVAQQAADHNQTVQTLTKAITAPRKKTAKRGKDGKIESVIEEVA